MASIEEALYTKLAGTAAVTALVGTRIYPASSVQVTDPQITHVTYEKVDGMPYHTHDGPGTFRRARMSYTAKGPTFASAKAIGDAVLAALDGFQGTVLTVQIQAVLSQEDGIPDYDPETRQHLLMVDFETAYKLG